MGQVLRPVQLRGRDRKAGTQPAARADDVVRPVGQRPGARPASAGQRPIDATAGGHGGAPAGRHATPFDQVEAETGVPHVVQSGLVVGDRRLHGQPVLAGVAADGRRAVRQWPRVARAHARQADGQVVAQTVDRAQSDHHGATGTAAPAVLHPFVQRRRRFPEQKTKEQKTK